jgi:hypothetical protein
VTPGCTNINKPLVEPNYDFQLLIARSLPVKAAGEVAAA